MWLVVACAAAAAYSSHAASVGYASQPAPAKPMLDWEHEEARRKHERDAEDRKIRRQAMYGTMLLIAFVLSGGYLVYGFFA